MTTADFKTIPGMSKEVREELAATFDVLSNWRDEIETVNERCLKKVLNRTSAVARAMGWPDQAVRSTREYLEGAAKAQTQMIDQIIEGWKQQVQSTSAPMAIPQSFTEHPSVLRPKAEFNPLAPWMFWLQAAEMWQRTWMPGEHKDKHPH
jgi:predicted nucleic acid-binding Zn ribbon protein